MSPYLSFLAIRRIRKVQNGGKFALSHKKGQRQTTDKNKNIMNHAPSLNRKALPRSFSRQGRRRDFLS